MHFTLLEEEWIPALYHNGEWKRIGILQAFEDAGRIRQIAASNPMDRVAILRFLLALLYWCQGNPPGDSIAIPAGKFPGDWFVKLHDNRDCFNLLGGGKRFYQDRKTQHPLGITDLLQEIPTGNNFWHFRHATDKKDGLCPACCAFGLLRLPLFSVSGTPDRKAGINGTPPIYAIPVGESLWETLTQNWQPRRLPGGTPAWIQPDIFPTLREEVPVLIGLTQLSRRVWLHDPEPVGTCICCGEKASIIRTCEYQSAGIQENEHWSDPHVLYSEIPSKEYPEKMQRKKSRASDLTVSGKFKMDRPWSDLLTKVMKLVQSVTDNQSRTILLVGFATDKAKNIDVWERTLRIPAESSHAEQVELMAQSWQKEAYSLALKAKPLQQSNSSRKHPEIAAILSTVRPHVEGIVSDKADTLITVGEEAWQQAAAEYKPMMAAVAQSLAPGFTTQAVRWRRQVARGRPNMHPKAELPEKPKRRKKGEAP